MTRYVAEYREEYERLTTPTPQGGGYPSLVVSPFVSATQYEVFVVRDGVVIVDCSVEPEHPWWIAGGPALMSDFPDTRTPPEVVELLREKGLLGEPIGVYRLVAKSGLPEMVWRGELGPPAEELLAETDGVSIAVKRFDSTLVEILQRLTFGVFGLILDIHLPAQESDFWTPHIVRSIGFMPADRHARRFMNYLEVSVHVDAAAWDPRGIRTRVQTDLRRDFAWAFSAPSEGGGAMSFGQRNWIEPYRDRLSHLGDAIEGLSALLAAVEVEESVLHQFLLDHPILLDVYGRAISKPRLIYPEGRSPLGKKYVEPDFIVCYPGRRYKLFELERPGKRIATTQGQPRAEVTQSVFQIAEWRAYISNHYQLMREHYPGISTGCSAAIVISRSSVDSFGQDRDEGEYQELLRSMYPDIEILTLDDLIDRARAAYTQLASLGGALPATTSTQSPEIVEMDPSRLL